MSRQTPCMDCRKLTRYGPRCEVCEGIRRHVKDEQRKDAEPHRAAYNDPRWRKAKRQALLRDDKQCRALINGKRCTTDAVAVHHEPSLRELWESGRSPFDLRYLYSMCREHHDQYDAQRRAQ